MPGVVVGGGGTDTQVGGHRACGGGEGEGFFGVEAFGQEHGAEAESFGVAGFVEQDVRVGGVSGEAVAAEFGEFGHFDAPASRPPIMRCSSS